MAQPGLMIVLEGSDGAGKNTQFKLLAERLRAAGYDVATFDFPQYNKESSYFVRQYLSGSFGSATKISPFTASLFYALDRFEAAPVIRQALKEGKIVLADRYTGSNMAYQGAKFADPVEQRGFFVWDDNLEFQLLDIPRPDINLFLRVPAEVSAKLINKRSADTGVARDEHEKDKTYLKKSVATYDLLCQLFPKDFTAIECTKDDKLLSIPQISDLIWSKIKPLLPPEPPHHGHPTVVSLGRTAEKKGSVSRQSLGDDKMVHPFKNTSLLLKLAIERQVSSVNPPGFSIWSDNDYRFYTPLGMPKDIEKLYKSTMHKLSELHQTMRRQFEVYYERTLLSSNRRPTPDISSILLPATPLAALCDFEAIFTPSAIEKVARQLLASDSPELQWTAQQVYLAGRQSWPALFNQSLESSGSAEPLLGIIGQLAEDKLSLNSGNRDIIRLLEASPRQEFDVLAESIYPYSSLSLEEISQEVSNWSYLQKFESLKSAARDSQILAKIRYKFDIVSDQLTMAAATSAASLSSIQVQVPSPRFGYDVPAVVEEAGIEEQYLECFDESLKLFSALQRADRDDLTAYATLLGHKLRWQFQADAKTLKDLLETSGAPSYHQLLEGLRESVAEIHPLTWEVLIEESQPKAQAKSQQNRVKSSRRRRPKPSRPIKPADK